MKANGIKGDVSSDYSVSASLQHRKRFGQFFTPPRIALLMADWVLSSGASRIVDPAFGTGALAEACLSRNPDLQVTGYEKDSNILAFVPNEIRSKVIIHETDFLTADVSRSFDGVIMNPPYIRHREIKDKEPARSRIAVQTGCFIPASANLYVYFILKGIAVTTPARAAALPDVPTTTEAGYPNVVVTVWNGFFVPAKTPKAIADKLGEAILAVAAMPDIKQKLGQLGFEPTSMPGEQFQRAVVNELATWREIVEKANIKPQ